jgi:hypothetical protein
MKAAKFKVGDQVKIEKIPPGLSDSAGIDTSGVFKRALGRTFRIEGFDERGHIELVIAERRPSSKRYESDTIWIEPEFVARVAHRRKSK